MIQRSISYLLTSLLSDYPAAALLGPRQCGKTTLAKSFSGRYFDMETDSDRRELEADWEKISQSPELVIFDEAQQWPELFRRLRGAIDRQRDRHARFLLLGSIAPALITQISESLAGRLALLELTPLLAGELSLEREQDLWFYGGYPNGGILNPHAYPRWQIQYVQLLSQRDLPLWGMPATHPTTFRFLQMLAVAHGQVWNASQIGQSMGIDHKTANRYLDFLVGAFLIRRLQPYQVNIRKRLVKSPKIFWRDTGLLHAMLNVPNADALLYQPWVGASWEGFVIEQILGALFAAGKFVEPYYFRTSDQHEIDLVLDFGTERWAIEIKLSSSPSIQDMERLATAASLIGASRRFLLSRAPTTTDGGSQVLCNLASFLKILAAR